MKHLSGVDNLFLALERPDEHLHVACLSIYDPSTAPGGKVRFKAILNHFASRMHQWKQFRRRLVAVPLGLDRPHWIDEPEIDLEYHVRHIALPYPGDWRQLMIQVARIHSRPLDMTKPLWEAYVIEGLDNIPGVPRGGFALYVKIHHAAIDGEAGAQLVRALHSLTAEPDAGDEAASPTLMADREPTSIELYARALSNRTHQVVDASKLILSLGARLVGAGKDILISGRAIETGKDLIARAVAAASMKGGGGGKGVMSGIKPRTRFDHPLSPHRVVDAIGLPLDDFAKIRAAVDNVTVNDIFLATVGGALRKYLEARNELPEKSIVAMVPMSTRGEAKDIDAGNQLSMSAVPLASDIADPLERLRAVRRGSGKSKAMSNALGKDLPGRLINILPAAVTKLLLTKGLMSLANITVSNVRGPNVPLYLAGARLQSFLPVSAVFSGLGLNVTGFSYNGTLWVCAVSCRKIMPDPAFFAECLQESFAELLAAATDIAPGPEVLPSTAPAKVSRPARKRPQKGDASPAPGAAQPRRRQVPAKPAADTASATAESPVASAETAAAPRKSRKPRKKAVAASTGGEAAP